MTKIKWRNRIKQSCIDAGTYREYFDDTIDTLAGLMELRDNAMDLFKQSGGNSIVKHTNKAGATNIVKNPALVVVMDCQAQALAYWRDLGLTPLGLKRIDEQSMKPKQKDALAEALADFG